MACSQNLNIQGEMLDDKFPVFILFTCIFISGQYFGTDMSNIFSTNIWNTLYQKGTRKRK